MESTQLKPNYLFEVSWEVCNKVGGIHTVIATKAKTLVEQFGDQYILIGPDVWKGSAVPEFNEDPAIFKSWKEQALSEGLKIRIGRWKIAASPVVILVDFTSYFSRKNEIFSDLWQKYRLDSLTGGWDYIEPTLFGYATGQVIECFYRHHLNYNDKIIAQFHEWMTGGGILYLKENVPQIGTVFTTHATVLGRAIAGSGVPFYSRFDSFESEKAMHEYNVVSKHSLEKLAANVADSFTTVSEITEKECVKFLGRKPNVITHNGFDTSILPDENSFGKKRAEARAKVIKVAEGLLNQRIPQDAVLVLKSGRYEYKNKGINLFIDSLAELSKSKLLVKTVVGVIFVPANQTGPRREVLERIEKPDFDHPVSHEILTHYLQGAENDPILREADKVKLSNQPNSKVKLIFVPTYLDGNDGVFNKHYYDLLIGFDLAIFPSYYEPWGYTPLESIAYHVPAVTTNVAGFGAAINSTFGGSMPGISVIPRTDSNDKEVISELSDIILGFTRKSAREVQDARRDAFDISQDFLWSNLIENYEVAYHVALVRSDERESLFHNKPQVDPIAFKEIIIESTPSWRTISVEADFPEELLSLQKIIKNLWWTWNYEAEDLFEYIDAALWERCGHNPSLLIRHLSFTKMEELAQDSIFTKMLDKVERKFDAYMSTPMTDHPRAAYFSMEYGLCSFVKLYSGGLGVLAGDYLKEASDAGINVTAVGLLYKNGYFKQKLSVHGEQLAEPDMQDFTSPHLQLVTKEDQTPLTITIFFPNRSVQVQIWRLSVGRVPLYLLDTDLPQNYIEDRGITDHLYDSNHETRLKQEIILGFGGIRALNALGIKPDVYHCNEGHASFIGVERIRQLVKDDSLTFEEAVEIVRSSTLFTTHTSVPAAMDLFSEELLRKYLSDKPTFFNIEWSRFMALGRANPNDPDEKFSMAYLGARLSQEINAVSKIHRRVSRRLFSPLWRNFKPGELHIDSITNGVHYGTWAAKEWQQVADRLFAKTKATDFTDEATWKQINDMPAADIWKIRTQLKKRLVEAMKSRLDSSVSLQNNPKRALTNLLNINENALFIGFARRFVTYKRSGILFTSPERLSRIIANADRPVIFIFSGKAHPADSESIRLITQLVDASLNPAFKNSIIFLEDYNMDIARLLVQGVDVWLNTPERYVEASGTSGMKAAINGVLNFSVLDGWWAEGYNGENGWSLSEDPVYSDNELQKQLDAETIYNMLENDIIPLFFDRNEKQVPVKWVDKIKNSLISLTPQFTMTRMANEYLHKYYEKLYARVTQLRGEEYGKAKCIVTWKKNVLSHWNEVDVVSIEMPEQAKFRGLLGEEVSMKIVLDTGKLTVNDIGVDLILTGDTLYDGCFTKDFKLVKQAGRRATYEGAVRMERTGKFEYAFRIFPKKEELPHRQDFDLVKWI